MGGSGLIGTLAGRLRGRRRIAAVVPLGASCRVSWQLRRHLGDDATHPFDWWIAPMRGMTRYLAELDPAKLYDPEGLEEMVVNGAAVAVRSRRYDVRLLHEFPRIAGADGTSAVAPDWRDHVAAARARHEHLLGRLRALDRPGSRILFVRHKLGIDEDDLDPRTCVADLRAVLARQFARSAVALLLVNVPGAQASRRDGIRTVFFDDPDGDGADAWRGVDAIWSRALAASGL